QPQTIQPQTIQPQTIQPQTIQPPVLQDLVEVEELMVVEDEDEFGELIEVDEIEPPFFEPVIREEKINIDFFGASQFYEDLEELDVYEEAVEELEAIDE
ncbi:MAG: hypothetical protein JEY91_04070, partial [Spirochaetaceae bacterium]|nr:hypothetical protein [Spirochaetaceae bacterium]